MKLEKEALLAIIETALFTLGAIFFLLVLLIPSNPIWALIAGILLGLTGAIIWSYPFFVRLARKIHSRIKSSTTPQTSAEDVAKKILTDDDFQTDGYELHRADSYDNFGDEIITDTNSPETNTDSNQPSN